MIGLQPLRSLHILYPWSLVLLATCSTLYGGKNLNQCHHRAIAWRDVKHSLQSVKGFYLCPFLCCEVIGTPLSEIRSSQSYCRSYYNLWCFIDVFLLHQRGWLCRRHRWTHRRIVSQHESNATTELMPGEVWRIRVCLCVWWGCLRENQIHESVGHDGAAW